MKMFGPNHNHAAPIILHRKGTKVCYCKRRDSAAIDKCDKKPIFSSLPNMRTIRHYAPEMFKIWSTATEVLLEIEFWCIATVKNVSFGNFRGSSLNFDFGKFMQVFNAQNHKKLTK